mmetsp:Transcript_7081/g.9356  ORF Transcript_7081/g.9356 Transcript_7081/m.9356 type:complete len:408 (+) Transcript_7081:2-1225(+)
MSVTQINTGVDVEECTGEMVIPSTGGLVKGQKYYARVFALNMVGYSDAGTAPTYAKPTVVPGLPTSVTLAIDSSSSLTVEINPPYDDGGDTIDEYLIEWSTASDFSTISNSSLYDLAEGAPFAHTIEGLDTGTYYYVRVRAHNSQGYGSPQASSPSFLSAYSVPDEPQNVLLGATSSTMLTVSWDQPSCCDLESILSYLVEWDISPTFDSLSTVPDKGTSRVGKDQRAFTIEFLDKNAEYYVRVAAQNSVGLGAFQVSSPASLMPRNMPPGCPVGISATTGDDSGEIYVRWDYPVIPYHSYPCFGDPTSPSDCPTEVGGYLPTSNGGTEIYEYRIQWSIDHDFFATETDSGFTDVSGTFSYTISNLTVGYTYFIRIAARNCEGYSIFCEEVGSICKSGMQVNATSQL